MILFLYQCVDELCTWVANRRKQKKLPFVQRINVVQYPDRIFFETHYWIINSYSVRSNEITILEINSSDSEIGKTILKHLDLSKTIKKITDQQRTEYFEA
jgi:hypothetical protein